MHFPDRSGVKADAKKCMLLYQCLQVTHCLTLPNVNWEGSVGFVENPTEEFEFVI